HCTLSPHYVSGGTIPEEYILYHYDFFDLHDSNQVGELHQTLVGWSNSICATPMGTLFNSLQGCLPFQLYSLGVVVCRDQNFSLQNALLVFNPKHHTKDHKGQAELLNLVCRINLIQLFVDIYGEVKENQPALLSLWENVKYEINQEARHLTEQYGSGYMSRYPIAELVPYWQSQKPRQMGVIYTSLADSWVIPVYLTAMTTDENGDPVPLEVRRYTGNPSLFACFGWNKKQFDALVNCIESIHSETTSLSEEIVGHAWGSGYYWIEKLMENARLLQFIKKQKKYALCSWEEVENQHLARLLHDIKRSQYYVMLQPQVSLADDDWTCHGAEALVRRRGTVLSPDVFVPLFEEQGIVRHVDFFVLDAVCYHIAKWRREEGKSIRIAVNLSRVTLMEDDIVESIRAVVDSHEVPHELVMMEITEREGLIKSEVSQSLVKEFRKHGFMVSLDDFGSDSSNLGALSKMSVDEVKVDKSLVDHIGSSSQHEHANKVSSMVRNIAKMCQEFDYKTITLAEGIENQDQADALRDFCYDLGQGYFFDKPLEIEAFYHKYIRNAKK
ncbi:MAG: EAL domain-containing protein, partial [Eubacteriales bacterium]